MILLLPSAICPLAVAVGTAVDVDVDVETFCTTIVVVVVLVTLVTFRFVNVEVLVSLMLEPVAGLALFPSSSLACFAQTRRVVRSPVSPPTKV